MPNPTDIERAVLAVLRDSPGQWQSDIIHNIAYCGFSRRDVQITIRGLSKRGLIRYIRTKADGGPGWVLADAPGEGVGS